MTVRNQQLWIAVDFVMTSRELLNVNTPNQLNLRMLEVYTVSEHYRIKDGKLVYRSGTVITLPPEHHGGYHRRCDIRLCVIAAKMAEDDFGIGTREEP